MPREMPSFDKSPAELVERFRSYVARRDDLEPRQMFGYPSGFVGGNLATGLHKTAWFVRLPADAETELRALGGGSFEPMPGRPMRGYVTLPESLLADDAIDRSLGGPVGRVRANAAASKSKSGTRERPS